MGAAGLSIAARRGRRALALEKDDHVAFVIEDDGAVRLYRGEVQLRSAGGQ